MLVQYASIGPHIPSDSSRSLLTLRFLSELHNNKNRHTSTFTHTHMLTHTHTHTHTHAHTNTLLTELIACRLSCWGRDERDVLEVRSNMAGWNLLEIDSLEKHCKEARVCVAPCDRNHLRGRTEGLGNKISRLGEGTRT